MTVNSGGTVAGYGSIGSLTAQSGARIAAGNLAGILTALNVALSPGATLAMEVGKTAPGVPTAGVDYD